MIGVAVLLYLLRPPAPVTVVVDFERPRLEGAVRQVRDPYVAEGVTFSVATDLAGQFRDRVVGLVTNRGTSACVEPADANQKLGAGRPSIGLAAFPIRATFSPPLQPTAGAVRISVEFQGLAGSAFRLRLFDRQAALVGDARVIAAPPDGTCGLLGNPRTRVVAAAASSSEVASVVMDEEGGSNVFVIDAFTYEAAAQGP